MYVGLDKIRKNLKSKVNSNKLNSETITCVNNMIEFINKLTEKLPSKVVKSNNFDYRIMDGGVSLTTNKGFYLLIVKNQYRFSDSNHGLSVLSNVDRVVDLAVKDLEVYPVSAKYLYKGNLITASCKREAIQKIIALDMTRVKDTTKQLYERLNEGCYFDYNSRNDDDFQEYIDNTIQDEIHDIIKSDTYLIRKCIEKRVSNASIVFDALYRAFNDVKKRCHINVDVTSDKMKNWFVYNGTDYKTALKNIIDELTDFREELRESSKR